MVPEAVARPIRIGISACLLGECVRYDGGHKHDSSLIDALGRFVEWVPVCPEVEAGFGTPREPMQLVQSAGGIRLLTVHTTRDVTARLDNAAARLAAWLAGQDLSGYVLKSRSPSCGLDDVEIHDGTSARRPGMGRGRFAERLRQQLPALPVDDEAHLADAAARERFVERVVAYWRARGAAGRPSPLG
jgi:uncharacterized protein YbbK (DUF523 family)